MQLSAEKSKTIGLGISAKRHNHVRKNIILGEKNKPEKEGKKL